MNFYIWWIVSIIASFGMEIQNELRLFKDVADEGYKVDNKKLSELQKQINPDATKISLLQLLIPGFNIFTVFKRAFQYNQIRPILLNQLSVMGLLETMSEEEKKEYQKKPTGLNALIVPLKHEIISKQIDKSITLFYEDKENKVEFKCENDDITIIKILGPMSNLSEIRQKEIIKERLRELFGKAINKYGDVNSFAQELAHNKGLKINLSDVEINEENNTKDMSIQQKELAEQKEQLMSYRDQILSAKENQDDNKELKNIKIPKLKR